MIYPNGVPSINGVPIPLPVLQYMIEVRRYLNTPRMDRRAAQPADLWFKLSPDHQHLYATQIQHRLNSIDY